MGRDYKNIVAWQISHKLTVNIYNLTRNFPKEEIYGITSQLRRAASSVSANIVEGSGRETNKDYLRFLYIARASLKETEYFVLLSKDLGYLSTEDFEFFTENINHSFATLHGLIKAVKKETGDV